jgi:hypothetical protein
MFKPSKKEFECLFDELFEDKKNIVMDLMRYSYKEPHDYLFLNVDTQRIYQDFDEIILEDE